MAKISTAGNYGKEIRSDCMATFELTESGGLQIELISKIKDYFGEHIVELVTKELKFFGIKNARLKIEDRGSLDYVIAARIEAAIKQQITIRPSIIDIQPQESTLNTCPIPNRLITDNDLINLRRQMRNYPFDIISQTIRISIIPCKRNRYTRTINNMIQ